MITISLEEKIRRCIERHPDWTDLRISNSVGTSVPNVKAFRTGQPIDCSPPVSPSASPPRVETPGIVSLEKVIQKYDIAAAILRELAQLPQGKLLSEQELCQRVAGTDRSRFRRTVENNPDRFRPLRIQLKLDEGEKKWWWGNDSDISEAQRIRDL